KFSLRSASSKFCIKTSPKRVQFGCVTIINNIKDIAKKSRMFQEFCDGMVETINEGPFQQPQPCLWVAVSQKKTYETIAGKTLQVLTAFHSAYSSKRWFLDLLTIKSQRLGEMMLSECVLQREDTQDVRRYIYMTPEMYNTLLDKVSPHISSTDTNMRDSISGRNPCRWPRNY
ncbi:hypothetical protein Hamer_G024994, partial [Homarus americanus]